MRRPATPPPLVSWPDREGEAESSRCSPAPVASSRAAPRRLRWRDPSGRARTERHLHGQDRQRSFPTQQSVARETRMIAAVRNTGTQTVPNVAVSIDSFAYTSDYPEPGLEQAADLGDRKRPRRDPAAPGRERGGQPPRRRPDRLRQHLGARRARARPHEHVRLARDAGQGRPLHRPLHGRRRALRSARAQLAHGGPAAGTSRSRSPPGRRRRTSIPTRAKSCPAPTRPRREAR